MNPAELDAILHQSLADHKLSGSEKQTLTGFALKHIDADQDRAVARSRAFDIARQAITDDETRRVLSWLEGVLKVVYPSQSGPADPAAAPTEVGFSPGEGCLRMIVGRFAAARRSADVCVFTVTDDRITRAILDAHRRGVKVRLISDNDKAHDLGSDVGQIAAAGVAVKVDHTPFHMHHKFAIFDGVRLLDGSYNWTRGAANDNEENLIDIGDPRLLAAFRQHFEALWEKL
ncbi:MAG TPA: phospholipase D-like domain-containing protein [Fimbriiglobus sp.]|nr:phospholipase D-like domain-containing protein [Fimbriiglobus sp.]